MDSMVNSTEEEVIGAQETAPEELSSTSGMDDLRAAFASSSEESGSPAPESSIDSGDEGDQDGAPKAPVADDITDEDLSKVFQNPRVVQMLRQAQGQTLAQQRALWEQEQLQRQRADEEALLSDEEIGQRVRQQKQIEPIANQLRAEGYSKAQMDFLRQGIGSVWEAVPELKDMDPQERQKFNPTDPKFASYGDYMNTVIEHVANARAEKLAAKRAEKLAKVQTRAALDEFRKSQPNPAGVPGAGSAPGRIIDVDKMSGKQILEAAFSAR